MKSTDGEMFGVECQNRASPKLIRYRERLTGRIFDFGKQSFYNCNLLILFFLIISLFSSKLSYAADCTPITSDNNTVTISANCGNLTVTGNNNNITIDSGVLISGASNNKWGIVTTGTSGTNITVKGNIGDGSSILEVFGIYHDSGDLNSIVITSTGIIKTDKDTGIHNNGTISTIDNSGVIYAEDNKAITNESSAIITSIINRSGGEITTEDRYAIKNINNGLIGSITNAGTITAQETAIRNYGSNATITTLTNSGTITSTENTIQNENGAKIGAIINTGEIRATGTDGKAIRNQDSTITTINNSGYIRTTKTTGTGADFAIWNDGTATINEIINSGTISVTDDYAIKNNSLSTIGTITNSGTISAGGSQGINNLGTITEITNTGTITASGGSLLGIQNDGTITTLNNSQGASSSALNFKNNLPTNYNAIINSGSNYGKTVFSGTKSGTMSFGVHSSSTLTGAAVNTTYTDVISGLTESHLNSCNSDTDCTNSNLVVGTNRYWWKLDDTNADDNWDLIITDIKSTVPRASELTHNPVIGGMNSLNSVTDSNSSHINVYDCDFFGYNSDTCIAIGGRYSLIRDPEEITDGIFLKVGRKITENLRGGGFVHYFNNKQKTPSNLKLSDKTPLVGSMLVWNRNSDGLGLQLKYANAFQTMNATIIRDAGQYSEGGTGNTEAVASSNLLEARYIFSDMYDRTIFSPYITARHAIKVQEGYTETGNVTPLTFNTLKDESITALVGSKFETKVTEVLNINTTLGFEYDIKQSIDKLAPTGMPGLPTVDLDTNYQYMRHALSVGFDYSLSPNTKISATLTHKPLPYDSMTETAAYLSFSSNGTLY